MILCFESNLIIDLAEVTLLNSHRFLHRYAEHRFRRHNISQLATFKYLGAYLVYAPSYISNGVAGGDIFSFSW